MAMSRQCDSCAGQESVDEGSEASIADYLETIVILQDEVGDWSRNCSCTRKGIGRQRRPPKQGYTTKQRWVMPARTSLAIPAKSSGSRPSWPVAMRRLSAHG